MSRGNLQHEAIDRLGGGCDTPARWTRRRCVRGVLAALGGQGVQITPTSPHTAVTRCSSAMRRCPVSTAQARDISWAGARTVARGAVTLLRVRRSGNHIQSFFICYDLYGCTGRDP